MIRDKVVETARGQALADEYGIKFFETSAKSDINVVESFTAIAADIKRRLMDNPAATAPRSGNVTIDGGLGINDPNRRSKNPCCT